MSRITEDELATLSIEEVMARADQVDLSKCEIVNYTDEDLPGVTRGTLLPIGD